MDFRIFDHINTLLNAGTVSELCDCFTRIMCKYGFDQYALAYDHPDKVDEAPTVLATYNRDWVQYYFENQYENIDPVMLKSKSKGSDAAFLWNSIWSGLELTKIQKQMFHEAKDYGLTLGLGIPILLSGRDNGMISLASSVCKSDELETIVKDNLGEIAILSTYFQQLSEKFISKKILEARNDLLTERESECLTWAARGKSNAEIGMILEIHPLTVKTHLTSVGKKLNVVNRAQACAQAVHEKIIQPF